MKNMRSDADEIDVRGKFLDMLADMGADVSSLRKKLMDYSDFDDFKYVAYRTVLREKGVTVEHLPAIPSDAFIADRSAMNELFKMHFTDEKFDTSSLFADCYDVREKIAKLTSMTESQLIAVYDDPNIEYVVRKYALAIRTNGIKETNGILDQALGKPVERHMTYTKQVSAIEGMTEDQIRKLLEAADGGSCNDGILEIEAEVEEDV